MAPGAGLEPATSKLTASCSTIELPGNVLVLYRNKIIFSRVIGRRAGILRWDWGVFWRIDCFVIVINIDYFVIIDSRAARFLGLVTR